MSRASLLDLIPDMQPWANLLIQAISEAGAGYTITSVFRTYAEQAKIYADHVAGKSKYPAARPGGSAHEVGMAFDVVLDNSSDQMQAGQLWQSWGGTWRQSDDIHFEWPLFAAGGPGKSSNKVLLTEGGPFYVLADLLISLIPNPFSGLLNRAQLATSLFNTFGGEANAATWYIQHPLEAVRDLFTVWRGAVEAELGGVFG